MRSLQWYKRGAAYEERLVFIQVFVQNLFILQIIDDISLDYSYLSLKSYIFAR